MVGGIGTFAAWVVVISLDLSTLAAGLAWMVIGAVVYVLFRRHQGLSLTRTVKVQSLEPLGVEEVEYQSVLIAFDEDPFNEEMVATAMALAARKRRAVHVISMLSVPRNLPLDARLDPKESGAQSKVEQAKVQGGQRVSGRVVRVRPGQAAGAIVVAAREIGAAAIVMQLRYRAGQPVYSKTLQTVLAKRPCRVIVAANPEEARARVVSPGPHKAQRRRVMMEKGERPVWTRSD